MSLPPQSSAPWPFHWDAFDPQTPEAPLTKKLVAALGNFDGVHAGHQQVLAAAHDLATAEDHVAAIVFDPLPRRYFQPDGPGFRLQTSAQRREELARSFKLDALVTLNFDAALAALSPEDFVGHVLIDSLNVSGIAIGFDFRFGRNRAGDAAMLERLLADHGVRTTIVAEVGDERGDKISSSLVRTAISAGDIPRANALLTRPWTLRCMVLAGEQRGRQLGFPTANMALGEYLAPPFGVYAVRARIDGNWYDAIANFGRTPTFGLREPLLEVHVFDFAGDLYGQTLDIAFVQQLRTEQKFSGPAALVAQIALDCEAARQVLRAAT